MFGIFKKNVKNEIIDEDQLNNTLIEPKEPEIKKGFFSRALEKTVDNFKSIVPKRKEKSLLT